MSQKAGPLDLNPLRLFLGCNTPGPTGKNDYADPFFWLKEAGCRLLGDTPGPLGINDHGTPQLVLSTQKISLDSSPTPQKTRGPLEVSQGQVTFDAEGNDNSKSPYYSRHIHWPGNAESGVTLGRGYDMGSRSELQVAADLKAAGVSKERAEAYAKGAGKKGVNAQNFVKDERTNIGEISQEEQKALFENIYPSYVQRARDNYDHWTKDKAGKPLSGKTEWDNLHWAIRDILVDFVYQGFTKGPNPMVKGMRNDFDELIEYIEGNNVLQKYEAGRKRAAYLKENRNK